jgi:putative inorganic carbon (HCO3(-)) transporter
MRIMIYENIIEIGILFLLIYTPVTHGGVTEYAQFLLQLVTAVLFLVWLARAFARRKQTPPDEPLHPDQQHYVLRVRMMPGFILICAFFVLIALQLVPLPIDIINVLSPHTYQLYAEAAAYLRTPMPLRMPLSVCSQATGSELSLFLVYPVIAFLIINTLRTPKQIQRMVSVILSVGFLEAFYGLLQMFSEYPLLPLNDPSPWTRGSFVQKNHFAGYLEMVILLAFGVLVARAARPGSGSSAAENTPPAEHHAKTGFLFAIVCVMMFAQVLSGSRGGIISFSVGLLFFLWLIHRRRLLRRWGRMILLFLPIVCVLAVFMLPAQLFSSLHRFNEQQLDPQFQVRWEIWRTQGHIFRDFPLVGSGFGTFSHLAQRYQTFHWGLRLFYSESDVMQILSETGILGVILVIWMGSVFFYQTLSLWRQRRSEWAIAMVAGGLSALVSLVMHSGVDFNLHIPSNALLFSVIAALTDVTAHTREHRET